MQRSVTRLSLFLQNSPLLERKAMSCLFLSVMRNPKTLSRGGREQPTPWGSAKQRKLKRGPLLEEASKLSPDWWRDHTPEDVQRARGLSTGCLGLEGQSPGLVPSTRVSQASARSQAAKPTRPVEQATSKPGRCGHISRGMGSSRVSSPRALDSERRALGCRPESSGWKTQGTR